MIIVSSCSDYAMVSVLSVVKRMLSLFQIIAPILCIVSLLITFFNLVRDPDNKKTLVKIKNTLHALFAVFFVPVAVNVVFGMLDDSTPISSCWEMANHTYHAPVYIPVDDRDKYQFLSDPSSYETGKHKEDGNTTTSSSNTTSHSPVTELIYYSQLSHKDVPFCSSGKTVAESGCGATCFAMIASSYSNSAYDPQVVANWFCKNKFSLSDGGLNEDAVSAPDTLAHFGLKGQVLFDKTNQSGMNYGTSYNSAEGSAILGAVRAGKAVMLGVPGHWIVAGVHEDCSSDQIYLYNPSRITSNGCYTPQELFSYTYNYSDRCSNKRWCGWDVAIALSN